VTPPVLEGRRVRLRPVRDDDAPRLHAILSEPDVARWWMGPWEIERVRQEIIRDASSPTFAIEHDDELIGAIQYYESPDPEYRHAGVDLFLDSVHTGRGLGVDAVRTLAAYLFSELGHHRLVTDPAAANHRSIKAFTKAGFREVGVMRRYERDPAGTWHDGVLMEMLAEELRAEGD
jgi:aminoglycoside 6'-N-acetyltransferase